MDESRSLAIVNPNFAKLGLWSPNVLIRLAALYGALESFHIRR